MALVQLGGGVLDARGSIGGQVFSRNRYGNYIRARITPVNPASDRQNLVRTMVQLLSYAWSNTLTQAQRNAWEVYADSIVRQNALGAQIKLAGFNHFVRSNVPRGQAALPAVLDGPTTLTLPGADSSFAAVVDEANQQISVTFDDSLDWVGEDNAGLLVSMSLPVSAGRTFVGGPYRFADSIDGASVSPPTSPATISTPFPVAEGQIVVVRARISQADGRLSDPFRDQLSVAA